MQDSFPLTVQPCVMPKDCETSEWSPWSPCSKTCRSGSLSPGVRSRSRHMKHIAIGGGQQCPELLEKETCIAEGEFLQPCPRYFTLEYFNSYNLWSGDRKVNINKHGQDVFLLNLFQGRAPLVANAVQQLKSRVSREGSHHSTSVSTALVLYTFQKCLSFLAFCCYLLPVVL